MAKARQAIATEWHTRVTMTAARRWLVLSVLTHVRVTGPVTSSTTFVIADVATATPRTAWVIITTVVTITTTCCGSIGAQWRCVFAITAVRRGAPQCHSSYVTASTDSYPSATTSGKSATTSGYSAGADSSAGAGAGASAGVECPEP
jgi:uncharacterized membrane protein YgcG